MACEKIELIPAYYDRELDATAASAVEAHLVACDECRALLEELRALSGLIGRAGIGQMPPAVLERAKEAWKLNRDRVTLRIASWATAAAAALLIGTLLFLPDRKAPGAPYAGLWETAATMPPEAHGESASEVMTVAQWMARDLGAPEGR